jgi:hypothetical protein
MSDHRIEVHPIRYSNCNGYAAAIVAVVNYYNGELMDWVLCWGGAPVGTCRARELEAANHVAEHGDMMSKTDAAHFCPDLPIGKYSS